ncbi:DUF6172 family protein [Paracidovorax citrulli]|uniref:DUF6172 family protein n=1 Tax=Paracidovorax citrulli TaxID=80869 RepID=UPI0005FAB4A2|nr:DUF6172 family protein [Paracidovorax citrulli]QCX12076.1 hypothetical protein APS58_3308 [Paracidovorax citrulli]UEG44962.1 DUF6172 family protein [Paracidovorax citrulli]UMT87699.1 hypothetical protein FRC90_06185 [Paracidovorax citrulli]UMT95737.1 hypothetical protein FRC97_12345 [Paracidovorax citrulli]WIY33427.1 DUF6172 family protein [Paracidovorax citrulli]
MRKTYVLHIDGKNRYRLLDAARHDIHRYLRRERRRALPEGARYWDFDCRFGRTQDDARSVQVEDITRLIDGVAQSGDAQFYVEIVAKPGEGMPRKPAARPADSGGDGPHAEDGDGADGGADGSDGGGDGGD